MNDREDRNDETDAQENMKFVEVSQPGVDTEARRVKKGGKSVFGYKQHAVVDEQWFGYSGADNCRQSA